MVSKNSNRPYTKKQRLTLDAGFVGTRTGHGTARAERVVRLSTTLGVARWVWGSIPQCEVSASTPIYASEYGAIEYARKRYGCIS